MKKVLCLLIVLSLCFSVASCGKNDDEKVTESETVIDTANDTNEETEETKEDNVEAPSIDRTNYSPLLYKISDEDSTVYLFGSIHVGTENMYPLPEYVENAYNDSQVLAVECDIVEFEKDTSAITSLLTSAMYLDGTTIADHVPEEVYEKAKTILEEQNTYNSMLDYYQPYIWTDLISTFSYTDLGYDLNIGIDKNFLEDAKENGKKISEIESVEFQYNMMLSFSPELQLMLLEEAVEDYDSDVTEKQISELVKAWAEGNMDEISNDVSEYSDEELKLYEEFSEKMVTNRNIGMTKYAKGALTDDKNVFICVGALHIVGEGGVVDLLEKDGYTVELVK